MRSAFGFAGLFGLSAALATGCGGASDGLVSTTGVVKVNGEPAPHARLVFSPEGTTKSVGGSAVTGADGKYEVSSPDGKKGLPPGTYKVVITRPLRKDGTPSPPDVGEMDSDAKETLPATYSDPEKSILKATIEPGKSIDFDLKVGKK